MYNFVIIFILILSILNNSFAGKPLRFTCKNYLLNAYLYIFISLMLIFSLTNFYATRNIRMLPASVLSFILLLFLSMILLLGVLMWSPRNIIGKHILWLLWLATMAYVLYPLSRNKRLF